MSQTENPKDVTTEQDSLDATLAGILSDALKSYGSTETALLRVGNDIPLAPVVRRSDSAIQTD